MGFTRNVLRLSGLLSLAVSAQAAYSLQESYDPTNFFEGFGFYSGPDPTNGFVKYATAEEANSTSLAGYANNGIYLGVDYDTASPTGGRASVRVESKKTYTKGLIIADIAHQPSPKCGQWPAFWTFGPNWPSSGEIDIIEGVNLATHTSYTLHTGGGCTFSQPEAFVTADCNAPGTGNLGCGALSQDPLTWGDGFNAVGGGVYALEWTSKVIKIFFFPRSGLVPADIASSNPNPDNWGLPAAMFTGSGCNIDEHFMNHQIIFDTTFCGDWAGKEFGDDPVCAAKASTCEEYVADNPADFKDSYWLINSVKVYSKGLGNSTIVPSIPRRFRA